MASTPPIHSHFRAAIGGAVIRCAQLELPRDRVREFLPAGLELGDPGSTQPPGTHPVWLFFQDTFRARIPFPSLLPDVTYREHSVGVPFTYISGRSHAYPGPYYFMPRLLLDNAGPTVTGRLGWGFAKDLGAIEVGAGRYAVADTGGRRIVSLAWDTTRPGEYQPLFRYPFFDRVREILDFQPIVSRLPGGFGPFFILSDFEWNFDPAAIKPLHTSVEVDAPYVPGYARGRYPASGWSQGIDESPFGSFQLKIQWRLSVPYLP